MNAARPLFCLQEQGDIFFPSPVLVASVFQQSTSPTCLPDCGTTHGTLRFSRKNSSRFKTAVIRCCSISLFLLLGVLLAPVTYLTVVGGPWWGVGGQAPVSGRAPGALSPWLPRLRREETWHTSRRTMVGVVLRLFDP